MGREIYRFNRDDAFRFAREIGATTRERRDELEFRECPYCHGRGKNNEYKFSINLNTGQFKCMRAGCGAHGNMIDISREFGFSLGYEADEYYRPSRKYWRPRQPTEPIKPKDRAVEYLKSRGIPEEIAEKYEISTSNKKGEENIMLFPFYDENGNLLYVKCRNMDYQKDSAGSKEYGWHKDMQPILFGMKQCVDFERLIITEGQLDSLSVATAGIDNAVSVPNGAQGFTWVPYCWNWVNQFQEIVIFGDHENGHISLLDKLMTRFKHLKVVREEDYKDCKDANELLQKYGPDAVRKAVENAKSLPVNHVLNLAEVERVNIYDIEKLKTGIKQLDDLLCGGLPFGSVVLIGGKRGEGKSTFASQIMVNAVDQGYVTMAYSGEMPNYEYRSWFDYQAAGPDHIIDNPKPDITFEDGQLLTAWYDGLAFVYDSRISEDDERASILETVRNTIMQYGARVILIDNLMTAMYDEPSEEKNKYDRQGWFVQELTKIALEFDCLILLVAHMRKNDSGDPNDDISGASEITNLASVTLSYSRDDKLEKDQRRLIVAKNRLFGEINTDGFVLDYDKNSKRIYGVGDDLHRQYGWEAFSIVDESVPFEDEDDDFIDFSWEDDDDSDNENF